MQPQQYERLHELFAAMKDLTDSERQSLIDKECAGDELLRNELEILIQCEKSSSSFIADPVLGAEFNILERTTRNDADTSLVGQRIGSYHLRRIIAQGGMGTVYEATQDEPNRTVAIKVLRAGLSSDSAMHRFRHESHILARLHHPHIAQVYEAGTLQGGDALPFFVMELIQDAKPLTEYADTEHLSAKDRITLFTKVCDAVHHGHQRGIVHRDIKPANILVDSNGEPKIIDFGVARATDSDITLTTLQTEVGQLLGTLQYMSPEQCAADPHDIDTRSDVYALGIVLYELLCGNLPYDVSGAAIHEAVRTIQETAPTRPSIFNRKLRGDLETITLKALEKQRERRYQSAAELARDLERYLNNDPIAARPPSAIYQIRKFARRHRALVAGLTTIVILLVSGIVITTVQMQRIDLARTEAVEAQEQAEQEKSIAIALHDFIHQVFDGLEPGNRDLTVIELLHRFSTEVESAFPAQPLEQAEIHSMIRNMYIALGDPENELAHALRQVELKSMVLGHDHRDTLMARNRVQAALLHLHRYEEAEELNRELLERRTVLFGEKDTDTIESLGNLGMVLWQQGRLDEAEPLLRRAAKLHAEIDGKDDKGTLIAISNVSLIEGDLGHFDKAEQITREILNIGRETLGSDDEFCLKAMHNLAWVLRKQDRHSEAAEVMQDCVKRRIRVNGEEHPLTLIAMSQYVQALHAVENYEEADETAHRLVELGRLHLGDDDPETILNIYNLAYQCWKLGNLVEAESLFIESIERSRQINGEDHTDTKYFQDQYDQMKVEIANALIPPVSDR